MFGKCTDWRICVHIWNLKTFFNFHLNFIFFGFLQTSKQFQSLYRLIFLIFCLTLQENRLFLVKKSWKCHFLLKGKDFLTKSMFCGWKSVHLFKISSISWQIGTHFEQKFQMEKLFRMMYSIDPPKHFFENFF